MWRSCNTPRFARSSSTANSAGSSPKTTQTGQRRTLEARALFVFVGADAHIGWHGNQVALDDDGFVLTGTALTASKDTKRPPGRAPFLLETSLPGVFAAGDVRSGSVKRVTAATGEGAMAVRRAHEHLEGLGAPLSRSRCMT